MPSPSRAFLHILIVVLIGMAIVLGALVAVADKLYEAIKAVLSTYLVM